MGDQERFRICLVSDFFCPNTGGVETHIFYLAQCLIARGHRVIVLTHAYPKRRGICYLSNGLKVYYLPFLVFYNGCILPTVFTTLPTVRHILLNERIQIVHGHSSFSTLAHESLLHAAGLGLGTVFTDHSLFGFADASAILTNKLLQFSLAHCDGVICVSHTSKENTVLRARLPPPKVSVIPNAVNCSDFVPDPHQFRHNPLTVVIISRLVYRKGTDFLASIIPHICGLFPEVRFVVGGDGPKRVLLEEVRERCRLQERVALLGTVPHSQVREILVQGQIFLNTSLTEAFCMAIVEAASCGLHVVTTKVGGIPEVLPPDLMTLAEPNAEALSAALADVIREEEGRRGGSPRQNGGHRKKDARKAAVRKTVDPSAIHARVSTMYHWPDVAERVETVYADILSTSNTPLEDKLSRLEKRPSTPASPPCTTGRMWLRGWRPSTLTYSLPPIHRWRTS